jgi:NAD(P)-dependent dehydrogenase (short-subunit alcohol dehydrogenase family)
VRACVEAVSTRGGRLDVLINNAGQEMAGSESLSPADYVATLASIYEAVVTSGAAPADVERRSGRFTADTYVADDSPQLWSRPIFPPGFHAPQLMTLARLQARTLKPAVLNQQVE